MQRKFLLIIMLVLMTTGCKSHRSTSFRSAGSVFTEMKLPTPNSYRTGSGAPGKAYWQQRSDHEIQVTLDTETNTIIGSQTILYTNNSPDELSYIWLQLEQNVHREDSLRSREGRSTGESEYSGIEISTLDVDGVAAVWHDFATLAKVDLSTPLLPFQAIEIALGWSFPMPIEDSLRMGYEDEFEAGPVWELAQWIPVPCVYDDVYGWNTLPYIGRGEFYTNFGDYTVAITVPHDHLVFGSGSLTNSKQVLTDSQQERLLQAMESEDVVTILSNEEVGTPESRPAGDQPMTWIFRGNDIRTFAWASSASFIWDAASVEVIDPDGASRRVLCQSAYPADKAEIWDEAVSHVQHAIKFYSEFLYPYPWPQMTVVLGKTGGMEYPMIVFCRARSHERLFNVTDHEVGHNWFPMLVNTDERRHAWMDEGFNTFVNHYSTEAYYEGKEHERDVRKYNASNYQSVLKPMNTPADLMRSRRYLSYHKPGYGMRFLREEILGEERFDAAFGEYIRRWVFKSPRPTDFYRTMEDASGVDLQWFFKGFFEETMQLDQALTFAKQSEVDDGWELEVTISNLEDWVCPVDLYIICRDGSEHTFKIPVTVWAWSTRHIQTFTLPAAALHAYIDHREVYPDIDRSNNAILDIDR